jgi:translation elongation factor EF-Ts
MHHTGSQEEPPVAAVEEQVVDEQEVPAQEVPEEEELQECLNHQPSSFERGKPKAFFIPMICNYLILRHFLFDA